MMEIEDDGILKNAALGHAMDYSLWPNLMPRVVARIEKIAREEYSMPPLPPDIPFPSTQSGPAQTDPFLSPLPTSPTEPASPKSPSDADKENTPLVPRSLGPMAGPTGPVIARQPGALMSRFSDWPQPIATRLAMITDTLETHFTEYPPHTIQRLAELLLEPKRHYRSLPAFLHAVDRVVHVTSGANMYPLPPAVPENTSTTLLSNGVGPDTSTLGAGGSTATAAPWAAPGSDEALGGALLTPIPWLSNQTAAATSSTPPSSSETDTTDAAGDATLSSSSDAAAQGDDMEGQVRTESTETIEGPNGMGSVETVSVSVNGVPSMGARGVGVTQGELLRQEQKAGVVPVSQLQPGHQARAGGAQGAILMQQRLAQAAGASGAGAGNGVADSPASSDTMDEDSREGIMTPEEGDLSDDDAAAAAAGGNGNDVMASVPGLDEEKPHARGPEEIGPEDTGPQHESNTGHTVSLSTSGDGASATGVMAQGIDVEAAVGRKADDIGPATTVEKKDGEDEKMKDDGHDEDKENQSGSSGGSAGVAEKGEGMDVDTPSPAGTSGTDTLGRASRESTPKREAEEDLVDEGSGKKLKKTSDADAEVSIGGTEATKGAEDEAGGEKEKENEGVEESGRT